MSRERPPLSSHALIAWKGARLRIAIELFASVYASVAETAGLPHDIPAERTRRWALEQAEQLLLDNEEMP